MNPQPLFCPDPDCPSRGKQNEGNLTVHDGLKDRFRGSTCQTTFSSRKGTLFYRLKTDPQTVVCVLVLLSFGCPVRAVVEAFCLDERTVRSWQIKAGRQCEQVHTRLVTDKPGQMPQVQADEMRLRCQKRNGAVRFASGCQALVGDHAVCCATKQALLTRCFWWARSTTSARPTRV